MRSSTRRASIAVIAAALALGAVGPARATAPAYMSDPEYLALLAAMTHTKQVTASAADYVGSTTYGTETDKVTMTEQMVAYADDQSVVTVTSRDWDIAAHAYVNLRTRTMGRESVGGIGVYWATLPTGTYDFQDQALADQGAQGAMYEAYVPLLDPYQAPAWAAGLEPSALAQHNTMDAHAILVDALTSLDGTATVGDVTTAPGAWGNTVYTVTISGYATGSPHVSKVLRFAVVDATDVVTYAEFEAHDDPSLAQYPYVYGGYALNHYGQDVVTPLPGLMPDSTEPADSGELRRSVVKYLMLDGLSGYAGDVAASARSAARNLKGSKRNKVTPAVIQSTTRTMYRNGSLGDSINYRRTVKGVRLTYSAFGQTVAYCVNAAPRGRVAVRVC